MHGRSSPILPFLGIEKKGGGSLALGVGIEMAVEKLGEISRQTGISQD
jgi:hypothetical protein